MNCTPKVSVVVPIYNVEKFLRQAVDSILGQTLKDIEVILVDDGSPDNCGKICDEYARKDPRVKVIHQPNGGLGNAYNHGIAAANGEYIGLVEPDDWIEPNMYEVMYQNAKLYNTDATKCGFARYNSVDPSKNKNLSGVVGLKCTEPQGCFTIEEYELLCAYHSSIWSYIYKSDFIKKIKFIETKGGAAYVDAPFGFEVLCTAKCLSIVPFVFYHWRVENHGNSVSLTDRRILAMADRFCEAKQILKRTGKYEKLKEIFYLHAYNANFGAYIQTQQAYKRDYFNKLHHLFAELKDDPSFTWKYFKPTAKKWVQNVYNNRFWTATLHNRCAVRRFLLDCNIKKNAFCFQLLGCQISKGDWSDRPAWAQWKIN